MDYANVALTRVARYSKRGGRIVRHLPLILLKRSSRLTSRTDGSPRDHR
jgi:hypothetical protein